MRLIFSLVIASWVSLLAIVQPAQAEPPDHPVDQPRVDLSASRLLENIVRQLSRETISISGDITVRKRHGVVAKELQFELAADWDSVPPVAHYTIRDPVGPAQERMSIIRAEGEPPRFEYAEGIPLSHSKPPNIFDTIRGTDISWADLTLSFLWWRDAIVKGADTIKGRECYLVEVRSPESADAADKGYARVLLWVDKELQMLLKAEGYNSRDDLMRRLWVKSFKKINDRWMLKDMEIESVPTLHRTRLHVRNLSVNRQPMSLESPTVE